MNRKTILTMAVCALCLAVGTSGWAKRPIDPVPPEALISPSPITDFYFWRLGHMDGPHDSSKALGISRDGKTAVGSTLVVDFQRAWRCDIDWAISTDDGVPPLYNELQVQEDIGVIAPSVPSAAFASSDKIADTTSYDLPDLSLDWGGSKPVGSYTVGTVSYGIEWLLPVLDSVEDTDYAAVPDLGGGASDMAFKDVTVDGLITVGYGNNKRGPLAVRVDMTDPLLPVLRTMSIKDAVTLQTLQWSRAEAIEVALDGTEYIAGYGGTKAGNRAFVSTVLDAATDPITLTSTILPMLDGGKYAEAYAMTNTDVYGLIIAGRSDSNRGPQACIWFIDGTTGTWVAKGLGALSKKNYDSVATGVVYRPGSASGDLLVVGKSKTILYASEAFVWTGDPVLVDETDSSEDGIVGYMYDLEYILTKTLAFEISSGGSEWILQEATGVSFGVDGTRIVGWGTNPEGGGEAWLVTGYPFNDPVFTKEEN